MRWWQKDGGLVCEMRAVGEWEAVSGRDALFQMSKKHVSQSSLKPTAPRAKTSMAWDCGLRPSEHRMLETKDVKVVVWSLSRPVGSTPLIQTIMSFEWISNKPFRQSWSLEDTLLWLKFMVKIRGVLIMSISTLILWCWSESFNTG